ncbi:hypothetical protein J8281_07025 [Aquimarina sp. U1-2]|uniref:hypothetical protein n=1 Tax=Aquimarina sp. U1-2 TaxID=2823141 RepID=UPI001AED0032|nr:hypothetical protein [Aquimarina sp. U1-2]MBP2831938.1 hypothetical protein [Aquimarina sp. U1-2]
MKLLLATAILFTFMVHANSSNRDYLSTEKNEKTDTNKKEEGRSENRNAHSVKRWKMVVEYTNGTIISKTIVVGKNSEMSALDTAFAEAAKHLQDINNIKNYNITPVSDSYVVLAGK